MIKNLYLLILGFMLIFQACGTVKISSNKQADYTKKPRKIFIMSDCAKEGSSFCNFLSGGLQREFINKGIQADFYMRDPLSLDTETDINKKISSYEPDAVLLIRQTVAGYSVGTYELTLIDGQTKKNVWKSEVSTESGSYGTDLDVFKKALKIVLNKLTTDEII
ncbi:hypothetical protein EOD41_18380 [Mucilaginibacter limnophilus]|uniref:DUF4136 domain-containing protein n=1 Tax=Mucilaginibacter limnophilus TaxID=1932778 RepID=A0A3S2UZU4_9SPHI|nr:hypothetical protein [Mucilaginibacter limnophilus]RVT98055.1 hypothetical protein EOD41_18380 [Mucilaginibacter limnophilus]